MKYNLFILTFFVIISVNIITRHRIFGNATEKQFVTGGFKYHKYDIQSHSSVN